MKRSMIVIAALFAVSCLAPTPLHATEGYLGLSYGESSADVGPSDIDDGSLSNFKVDDTDSAWKFFGGWHAKFVGVEVAWQNLGQFSIDAESDGSGPIYNPGNVRNTLDARGLSAEVLGRIPLGKVFVIFGKAGVMWWTSETITTGESFRVRVDDTCFDLMYGVGVDFIIKRIAVRLEYEKFDKVSNAGTSVEFGSIGIIFNF